MNSTYVVLWPINDATSKQRRCTQTSPSRFSIQVDPKSTHASITGHRRCYSALCHRVNKTSAGAAISGHYHLAVRACLSGRLLPRLARSAIAISRLIRGGRFGGRQPYRQFAGTPDLPSPLEVAYIPWTVGFRASILQSPANSVATIAIAYLASETEFQHAQQQTWDAGPFER